MQQSSSPLQSVRPASRPYAPSWVDALQAQLARLPWPVWLNYAALGLVLVTIETLLKWQEGTYARGTFLPLHLVEGISGAYALGLIHYLDRSASRALDAFRPALEMSDEEVEEVRYRLTTMPSGGALLALLIGVLLAVVQRFTFAPPNLPAIQFSTSGPAFVFEQVFLVLFVWGVGALGIYHTVRQLRLIDMLYRDCANIGLFNFKPLYAFASVSARTGVGILFIIYAWLATYPRGLDASLLVVFFSAIALLVLLATAAFIWPLWGAHQRLEAEKQRRKAEVNRRLEAALEKMHAKADAEDYTAVDGLNKTIAGFTAELALIEKVSTWPWQTSTLRGFLTAVFLPLFLWAAQQFLSRVLVVP